MSSESDLKAMYEAILHEDSWHTKTHYENLLILADMLEDGGDSELAVAYRYGSRHQRWPFRRRIRTEEDVTGNTVYDWDGFAHSAKIKEVRKLDIPPWARLDDRLYRYMRDMPADKKTYGTVEDAFRILGKALTALPNVAEMLDDGDPKSSTMTLIGRIDG